MSLKLYITFYQNIKLSQLENEIGKHLEYTYKIESIKNNTLILLFKERYQTFESYIKLITNYPFNKSNKYKIIYNHEYKSYEKCLVINNYLNYDIFTDIKSTYNFVIKNGGKVEYIGRKNNNILVQYSNIQERDNALNQINSNNIFNVKASKYVVNDDRNFISSVYVGNLDPDITEKILYDFFSSNGENIIKIDMYKYKNSLKSKKYAFIKYSTPIESENAMIDYNRRYIYDFPSKIIVNKKKIDIPSQHGYYKLSNLPENTDYYSIFETFKEYDNILEFLIHDTNEITIIFENDKNVKPHLNDVFHVTIGKIENVFSEKIKINFEEDLDFKNRIIQRSMNFISDFESDSDSNESETEQINFNINSNETSLFTPNSNSNSIISSITNELPNINSNNYKSEFPELNTKSLSLTSLNNNKLNENNVKNISIITDIDKLKHEKIEMSDFTHNFNSEIDINEINLNNSSKNITRTISIQTNLKEINEEEKMIKVQKKLEEQFNITIDLYIEYLTLIKKNNIN